MGVFRPIWYRKDNGRWEPAFWIGPKECLIPNTRMTINSIDRNMVLVRQNSKCNACGQKICLYPFSNADLDHIIPLSMGGKNVISNLQLLCVMCHRHKTAMENERNIKRFPIGNNSDKILIIYPSDKGDKNFDIETELEEYDPIGAMNQVSREKREYNYIVNLNYNIPSLKLVPGLNFDNLFQEFAYGQ